MKCRLLEGFDLSSPELALAMLYSYSFRSLKVSYLRWIDQIGRELWSELVSEELQEVQEAIFKVLRVSDRYRWLRFLLLGLLESY